MTAKRPRNPPKLWAQLAVTWIPLPNIDNPPPSFTAIYKLMLTPRGGTIWHAYTPDPPAIITHTIDLETGTTATEAFCDPPQDEYSPLETISPVSADVATWQPYAVYPVELPTGIGETTAEISFSEGNPGLQLPDHLSTCPGISGAMGPVVIENRAAGPNARTRSITCARPGMGQQALNQRFAAGAMFWGEMTPDQKRNWATVAKAQANALNGYAYYLGFLLTSRFEVVRQLRKRTGLDLPLPP